MAVPQTQSGADVPSPSLTHAGIALPADHPVVMLAWLLAGLAIAAGIGPWMSKYAGVVLPAFALVRTARRRQGA